MLHKSEVKTLLLVERKPVIHSVAASFISQKHDEMGAGKKNEAVGAMSAFLRKTGDEVSKLGMAFSYAEKTDRQILRRIAAKAGVTQDMCHIERYVKLIESIPVLLKDGVVAVSVLLRMSEEFDAFNSARKAMKQSKRTAGKSKMDALKLNLSDCLVWNSCDVHHTEVLQI